jgi:hypothetical protein
MFWYIFCYLSWRQFHLSLLISSTHLDITRVSLLSQNCKWISAYVAYPSTETTMSCEMFKLFMEITCSCMVFTILGPYAAVTVSYRQCGSSCQSHLQGSSNPRRLMHRLTSMPVSGFLIVEKIQTGTSAPWKWSREQETAHCSRSKSHESSCLGGQTANDPKLKENQLNIKWDMTGQSPGCYVGRLCHAMSHWVGACEDVRSIHTTGDRYWGVAEQHQNKTTANSFHILTFVPGKECRSVT